ncbi:hypothetical protein CVT24_012991 [Panaeolus cyanescens]|uniref:G domain-containing protein n=1 Tax=Panaeolus cyanescens TaxID=181874 RepID=A0A409WA57_9AGAR|nr:hypothetical protein CVT24_012991 [Panaeolus cyanescens]
MPIVKMGGVSIEPWDGRHPEKTFHILLLGATGSGKSSFIEALAGNDCGLGLSGGTLESVTQTIQAFQAVNLYFEWKDGSKWPVCLIDTPGFLDNRTSEVSILEKIRKWMEEKSYNIDHVFYFCRITDTRIPRSAQRLIELIKALYIEPCGLTIMTSMWDNVYGAGAMKRAEDHFVQLQNVVWKDQIIKRARIVKFENNQKSAMRIINGIADRASILHGWFLDLHAKNGVSCLVFQQLLDRIQNARLEKLSLLEERIHLLESPHPAFDSNITTNLTEIDKRLTTYIDCLVAYCSPSQAQNLNSRVVVYQHLLDITLSSQQLVHALSNAVERLSNTTSITGQRSALVFALQTAKKDYKCAYMDLLRFGARPKGFPAFKASVTLDIPDNIQLGPMVAWQRVVHGLGLVQFLIKRHTRMGTALQAMTRSAIKRAQDADPNHQRCIIENCSTSMAVQIAHVYNREEAASNKRMQCLEWNWGLIKGSLNLDTRRNVFFVGVSLYELYRRHNWSLFPEEKVVRQFFYEGRSRPRERFDFPNFPSQTFKYTFLSIHDMEDVCINRQSEDNTVTVHQYPFEGFPVITSHIHPVFVMLHLSKALSSISEEKHDAIVMKYPWLGEVAWLHTFWLSRLPANADENPTYVPSLTQNVSTASEAALDDDLLRTPPYRIPPSIQQVIGGLDVEPIKSPPSSTRAAPRILQVYSRSVQKREASGPIQNARPNKRRRLLTSTDLTRHDEAHQQEFLKRRENRVSSWINNYPPVSSSSSRTEFYLRRSTRVKMKPKRLY